MALFIQWATGAQSLTTFAAHHGLTRQTMHHRFRWCWWIIPTPTIDSFRIHDQIFLDAPYLKSGCLLIAASKTHVINCGMNQTRNHRRLHRTPDAPLPHHSSQSQTADKAPNQPSTTAGQQHASNAASSTPNEQSAATPPATPAPMPAKPSTA